MLDNKIIDSIIKIITCLLINWLSVEECRIQMLWLDNEAQSNKKCVPVMNSCVQSVIYRKFVLMHIKFKCSVTCTCREPLIVWIAATAPPQYCTSSIDLNPIIFTNTIHYTAGTCESKNKEIQGSVTRSSILLRVWRNKSVACSAKMAAWSRADSRGERMRLRREIARYGSCADVWKTHGVWSVWLRPQCLIRVRIHIECLQWYESNSIMNGIQGWRVFCFQSYINMSKTLRSLMKAPSCANSSAKPMLSISVACISSLLLSSDPNSSFQSDSISSPLYEHRRRPLKHHRLGVLLELRHSFTVNTAIYKSAPWQNNRAVDTSMLLTPRMIYRICSSQSDTLIQPRTYNRYFQ